VKLRGHIISVADHGGVLLLEIQVAADSDPDNTWLRKCELRVPYSSRAARSYNVGRVIVVTLELER
jgi:hypothetical protein